MYSSLNRDEFELRYSSHQEVENEINDDTDTSEEYKFQNSFLYKYMVYTFQYVDGDLTTYTSYYTYQLFKILRWLSVILMVVILGFKIYLFNLYNGEELHELSVFNGMVRLLVESIWMSKYVLIQFIGVYLFSKHQLRTPIQIESLFEKADSAVQIRDLNRKLKKIERSTSKIIAWTLLCLTVPPVLSNFSPIVIEIVLRTTYPWRTWDIELLEILNILYMRIVSLPFLFYIIHLSTLQMLHIDEYVDDLKSVENKSTLDELFQGYLTIHGSIQESVNKYKMYLRVIFGVIVTWGTVYAYFAIGLYRFVIKNEKDPFYPIMVFDYLTGLFICLMETVVLFTLPFYMLERVEHKENGISARILEISYSKMPSNFALRTLKNIFDLVRQIEKFQKHDETGYQVFGGKLSRIKLWWLITLSPLCLHFANAVITGKL